MCACSHAAGPSNPYAIEQLFTFSLWLGSKPPAAHAFRILAALAAVATICAMAGSSLGLFRSVEPECKVALQASALLTSCVVAVARWFR